MNHWNKDKFLLLMPNEMKPCQQVSVAKPFNVPVAYPCYLKIEKGKTIFTFDAPIARHPSESPRYPVRRFLPLRSHRLPVGLIHRIRPPETIK